MKVPRCVLLHGGGASRSVARNRLGERRTDHPVSEIAYVERVAGCCSTLRSVYRRFFTSGFALTGQNTITRQDIYAYNQNQQAERLQY